MPLLLTTYIYISTTEIFVVKQDRFKLFFVYDFINKPTFTF